MTIQDVPARLTRAEQRQKFETGRKTYFEADPTAYLPSDAAVKLYELFDKSKQASDAQISANLRYELIDNPATLESESRVARQDIGGLRIGHTGSYSKVQKPVRELDGALAVAFHPRYAHGVSPASSAKVKQNLVHTLERYQAADESVLEHLVAMNAILLLEHAPTPGVLAKPSLLRQRKYGSFACGRSLNWDVTAQSRNKLLIPAGQYRLRTATMPQETPPPHSSIADAQQLPMFRQDEDEAIALAGQLLSSKPLKGDFDVANMRANLFTLLADTGPVSAHQIAPQVETPTNWAEVLKANPQVVA